MELWRVYERWTDGWIGKGKDGWQEMRSKARGKRRRKGKPEKLMQSRMGVENASREREKRRRKGEGVRV